MNVESGRFVDSYPDCQDTQSGHQASLSVTSAERIDPKISTAWLLSGDTLKFPSLCYSCWVERLQGSSISPAKWRDPKVPYSAASDNGETPRSALLFLLDKENP